MRPLLMRDKTNRQSVNVLLVYKEQVVVALKQQHLVRRTTVPTQRSPKETIYIHMYIYIRLKIKPNSVRIRYIHVVNFTNIKVKVIC